MFKHHIFNRSHDLRRISIPAWLKFGFPLMYNTDALEVIGILTKLGCTDERMQEALELMISKIVMQYLSDILENPELFDEVFDGC